ncbi:MAG: hypothetical protein LKI25_07235 [Atopobiaceae bacterium]|jgi:hypothetical protein|nr:hypothetical protein [Atopobiaceae bacterium]MCI2173980.1 hypothetical protein [Atopobiaceae bacterium]MCI2207930.1 hypothetical protein [Atopobiaceae bacterium]
MSIRERWLPTLLAGTFVVAMCAVADATGCMELLFPEMAAILLGAWMQPRQAWNVSRPRMVALMGAGAVFGLCLNLLLPAPIWARALVAYAFCAIAMNVAGADMSPMVSATILPVLLSTTSWLYPAAVIAMVSAVAIGQCVMEDKGLREPTGFRPLRDPLLPTATSWGRRLLVFAALSAPAYLTGEVLFAVPPLLVAFTELTRPDYTLRLRPWRGVAVLACAAVIGDACRVAVELAGLPLAAAAALAFAGLLVVWNAFETWLPPAGAVALLALLVPWSGPGVFAVEVSVGALVWVSAAVLLFPGIRPRRRANDVDGGQPDPLP